MKSYKMKQVPMGGYKESESTIMVAGDKRTQTGVKATQAATLHITGPPLAVDGSLSADLMWWCLISCGVCGELAGLRPALL